MKRLFKTNEVLKKDLSELQKKYDILSASYEKYISDSRNRDEELKKSEEKFRRAFITSPDSININRLQDGMYITINEGFTKITGYTEDEIIGKTSLELNIWAIPEDRDKLVKGLREGGRVENLETVFRMKDGSERHGIMSATIIELNGISHILSVTRDITDRKYAAMALQESENKYRELIELAVDGILLGSPDGIIIGANSYILNLTGRSRDQILGLHINNLFTDVALQHVPLRFDLLKKGETVINERNIIRPDGKIIPVEMHSKMMPDGSYQSIFRDISERKEAEKALRESEEWFRTLFEQSADGIFYMTLEGKIVEVNNSFAELHGYTMDEILMMNIRDLDCPESSQLYNERMTRIHSGEYLKFEVEHFHKDGHRIPLEVSTGTIKMGSSAQDPLPVRENAELRLKWTRN